MPQCFQAMATICHWTLIQSCSGGEETLAIEPRQLGVGLRFCFETLDSTATDAISINSLLILWMPLKALYLTPCLKSRSMKHPATRGLIVLRSKRTRSLWMTILFTLWSQGRALTVMDPLPFTLFDLPRHCKFRFDLIWLCCFAGSPTTSAWVGIHAACGRRW